METLVHYVMDILVMDTLVHYVMDTLVHYVRIMDKLVHYVMYKHTGCLEIL